MDPFELVHRVQTPLYVVDVKFFFDNLVVSFDSLVVAHDQSSPTWILYLVTVIPYH